VSASALDALRLRHPGISVVGVIEPGASAAVAASRSQHIAVIGTEATIGGGAYAAAIHRRSPGARVVAAPCPLFVAMAEEGWTEGPIAEAVARRYLTPLFDRPDGPTPDTLVLGCTHFPVLIAAIRAVIPASVRIVDSAETTAAAVASLLGASPAPDLARPPGAARGKVRWLATDGPERFARVGRIFLQEALRADEIEIIDL
jgi:glutamate racemase